jgi:hypothetical protein
MSKTERFLGALAILADLLKLAVGFAAVRRATNVATRPDRKDAVQHFSQAVYVIVGSALGHPTAETSPDARDFSTWPGWRSTSPGASGRAPRAPLRLAP